MTDGRRGRSRGMSLGRWFLLWMVSVTVLVLGLSVAVVTLHERAALERRLRERGEVVARALARSAGDPTASPLAVTAVPECVSVSVRSAGGRLLWSFGPPPEEALEVDPYLVVVDQRAPAALGGGQVALLLSTSQLRAQVLATGVRLVGALTVALALALVVGALLLNGVVEPLRRLAGRLRSFEPDDPPELPRLRGGAREVVDLGAAFAQMSDRLAAQRRSLRESERRFRELFVAAPTPLLVLGEDLSIRRANPAAAAYLGDDPEAATGASLERFLAPADGERPRPRHEGEEVAFEAAWQVPGGGSAEVDVHLRRIEGEEGPLLLGAVYDLTDRLRREGERWRRIFDEMTDGVALVAADGTVELANRALAPHLEAVGAGLAERLRGSAPREWLARSAQRALHCLLASPPDLGATILLARDVTDSLEAEERLREAETSEAVATLASGVAHDFNNLLAGVLLHLRLLEREGRGDREALAAIRSLAEEGSEVVGRMLELAHREVSSREVVDLGELVAEQERLLRHLLPAGVELVVGRPEGALVVEASPSDLRRLLLNLVVNARDAVAADGGTITVSLGEEGGRALLEVADTGRGIAPELRERVFEPFVASPAGGTGLGLAVVGTIVAGHEGEVEAVATPEGGALIRVRLPLLAVREQER